MKNRLLSQLSSALMAQVMLLAPCLAHASTYEEGVRVHVRTDDTPFDRLVVFPIVANKASDIEASSTSGNRTICPLDQAPAHTYDFSTIFDKPVTGSHLADDETFEQEAFEQAPVESHPPRSEEFTGNINQDKEFATIIEKLEKGVPTVETVVSDVLPTSGLSVVINRWINLADDPIAAKVLRTIAKTPGAFLKHRNNAVIDKSGTTFGLYSLIGALGKCGIEVSFVVGAPLILKMDPKTASKLIQPFSETFSLILKEANAVEFYNNKRIEVLKDEASELVKCPEPHALVELDRDIKRIEELEHCQEQTSGLLDRLTPAMILRSYVSAEIKVAAMSKIQTAVFSTLASEFFGPGSNLLTLSFATGYNLLGLVGGGFALIAPHPWTGDIRADFADPTAIRRFPILAYPYSALATFTGYFVSGVVATYALTSFGKVLPKQVSVAIEHYDELIEETATEYLGESAGQAASYTSSLLTYSLSAFFLYKRLIRPLMGRRG